MSQMFSLPTTISLVIGNMKDMPAPQDVYNILISRSYSSSISQTWNFTS